MATNNFQKLMHEEEENYEQRPNDQIHKSVWGTLSLFRLVGDLVDVFIPRAMDIFVMVAGGRGGGEEEKPTVPPLPPSQGNRPDPGKNAPGNPEDIQ